MPRADRQSRDIDEFRASLISDINNEASQESEPSDGLQSCTYCGSAYTNASARRIHEGQCRYQYAFPEMQFGAPEENELEFGGEADNFEAEDQELTCQFVSRSQVERQEEEVRRAPQEEGLGYVIDAKCYLRSRFLLTPPRSFPTGGVFTAINLPLFVTFFKDEKKINDSNEDDYVPNPPPTLVEMKDGLEELVTRFEEGGVDNVIGTKPWDIFVQFLVIFGPKCIPQRMSEQAAKKLDTGDLNNDLIAEFGQ
ncbi:hypothetical protein THAOC_00899, partial [Thalassiosira oceanica]